MGAPSPFVFNGPVTIAAGGSFLSSGGPIRQPSNLKQARATFGGGRKGRKEGEKKEKKEGKKTPLGPQRGGVSKFQGKKTGKKTQNREKAKKAEDAERLLAGFSEPVESTAGVMGTTWDKPGANAAGESSEVVDPLKGASAEPRVAHGYTEQSLYDEAMMVAWAEDGPNVLSFPRDERAARDMAWALVEFASKEDFDSITAEAMNEWTSLLEVAINRDLYHVQIAERSTYQPMGESSGL